MGAPRIVPTRGIPYPTGDPELAPEEERKLRRLLVERALDAIGTAVEGPTVFELGVTSGPDADGESATTGSAAEAAVP